MIRPVRYADIDECVDMAFVRYEGLNRAAMREWALVRLGNERITFLRTKNAMCCVADDTFFWRPEKIVARMAFLVSRAGSGPWEAYLLLKEQMRQAVARDCDKFIIGSETGLDLGAFAKRLGLSPVGQSYEARL